MSDTVNPITDAERAIRRDRVDQALASVRLEGGEPSDGAEAIMERYLSGELTIDEMVEGIGRFNTREFGPLRLPGN